MRRMTSHTIGIAALAVALAATACGGGGAPSDGQIAYPKPTAEAAAPTSAPATDAASPGATKSLAELCAPSKAAASLAPSFPGTKLTSGPSKEPAPERSARGAKAAEKSYSMADLQALEQRSQWPELMQHVEDVAPGKRDAAWDKLVERAATGYLASLGSGREAFEALMSAESFRKRYPALQKSKDFMAKRGEAGKAVFAQCFQQSYAGDECMRMADEFVAVEPNPEVMLAIAKIVRMNQNAYNAVPFFKKALTAGKSAAMCKDEDLGLAIVAGLGLPPDEKNAKDSFDVASASCWAELKEPIVAALRKDASGYLLDNACRLLRSKGEVK